MSSTSIKPTTKRSSALPRIDQLLKGFLAVLFVAIGLINLAGGMNTDLVRLGYPEYLSTILGVAYLIAVVCIYQTRFAFLQEWAYGGMAVSLVAAAGSHILSPDPFVMAMPAFIIQAIFVAFYVLRSRAETNDA